jgi:hypothetical protein
VQKSHSLSLSTICIRETITHGPIIDRL